MWVCAQRSKILPHGGALYTVDLADIIARLQVVADFASGAKAMRYDDQAARDLWAEVYTADLTVGKPGLLGSVTSRAEPQTLRLACVYALLDLSAVIRTKHLEAALEIWRYCEDSARFIFGDALGDPVADEIIKELRQHPEGMTRNGIREHFHRNKSADEIGSALGFLQENGLARMVQDAKPEGQRRAAERWSAVRGVSHADAVNAVNAINALTLWPKIARRMLRNTQRQQAELREVSMTPATGA